MKKTNLIIAFAIFATTSALLFTGCPKEPDPSKPHVAEIVDLRNYKNDGTVLSRAANSGESDPVSSTFSYKIIDNVKNFDGGVEGNGVSRFQKTENGQWKLIFPGDAEFEALAGMVSFEDHPDGFKFVFKKAADYGNIDWVNLQYVDKNGNRSTAIEAEDWGTLTESGDFEIVYPLVNPNTSNIFWVMFDDNNPDHYSAYLFFEVNTIHGKGCVKPMQWDYQETDYSEILDGHLLHITKMIPPKAYNITHSFQLIEQKNGTEAYGPYLNEDGSYDVVTKLGGCFDEKISEEEQLAADNGTALDYTIDLADYLEEDFDNYWGKIDLSLSEGKPYIFTEFNYKYQLEGYDGYFFSTPAIKPVPVSSEYFQNLRAE
ncbi:hypothetical protein [Treponema sp.]|uniref:hypothetical protein n=1 Tax=Treponema sp. TaxID=166 RepID=UPI00298EC16D|nr:hypothetical protein [Treponema sp.]MCQ2241699.1 hypothetical protein [Treponema sp.]